MGEIIENLRFVWYICNEMRSEYKQDNGCKSGGVINF